MTELQHQVFGTPLKTLVEREKTVIPSVVKKTVRYLATYAVKEEGIGRQSSNVNEVQRLIKDIDAGRGVDFTKVNDSHAVCSVLKRFLMSLPEPVIPCAHYESFVQIIKNNVEIEIGLKKQVEALPKENACLLDYIMSFLLLLSRHANENKMTVENLSRVFAPSILSQGIDSLTWSQLGELQFAEDVVTNLVTYYGTIFSEVHYEDKPVGSIEYLPQTKKLNQMKNMIALDSAIRKQTNGMNILSFDGGGMRGLASLAVLSEIAISLFGDDDQSGTSKLISCFDLICGTSTGGIIAVGLAKGYSIAALRKLYYKLGTDLFSTGYLTYPSRLYGYYITGDYYSSDTLQKILSAELGTEQMRSLTKKVFVTSTNTARQKWEIFLQRSYDLPDSKTKGTADVSIPDALRATSAAPTYFSPKLIGGNQFVDGGMLANNPTEIAIFEAHTLWPTRYINTVLSIGTGNPANGPSSGAVNLLRLVNEIVDIATDSTSVHKRIKNWMSITRPTPSYFRFSPPKIGSIGLDTSNLITLQKMEEDAKNFMKTKTENINLLKFSLQKENFEINV